MFVVEIVLFYPSWSAAKGNTALKVSLLAKVFGNLAGMGHPREHIAQSIKFLFHTGISASVGIA